MRFLGEDITKMVLWWNFTWMLMRLVKLRERWGGEIDGFGGGLGGVLYQCVIGRYG